MRGNTGSCSLAALATALICLAWAGIATSEEGDSKESLRAVLWQPSMNVFRRFGGEPEAMFEFYGDVLGLEQLQTFDVGGGTQVARFGLGRSELKLTRRVGNKEYVPGGIADGTGLRLLTFFYPEREAVVERFRAHGYEEPRFENVQGSDRLTALVTDPEGHPVELVIAPDEPAEVYDTIEIGLTVSDMEESRAFYRDFVGLEELSEPTDRLSSGAKMQSYRHGTTIVTLRDFERDLPADTGTGGIQYVVSDVARVDELTQERGVTVDQPLSGLQGFDLRTIWLEDPDGVTNYFAETGQSRQARTETAR